MLITKKTFVAVFIFFASFVHFVSAKNKVTVSSPDQNVQFKFELEHGHPEYSVIYKNKVLATRSTLGLVFAGHDSFGVTSQQDAMLAQLRCGFLSTARACAYFQVW